MSRVISAVYENGILRPLAPLPFEEKKIIRIQILPEIANENEEILQIFVDAGLMLPQAVKKGPLPPDPVSEEERLRIAAILGQVPGKPLSEIVIEERGEL